MRRTPASWLTSSFLACVALSFIGCGGGTVSGDEPASPDGGVAIDDATATPPLEDARAPETDGKPPPHVEIRDGALFVDGVPSFLLGGDIHYFRVRDREYDAAKTKALWIDSLDKMKAAGLNLLSTYAPWDYHAPKAGVWDFSGARDLGAFLDLSCERGMKVVLKPGPLITGEWPRGFGTFGAVPAWWKEAHPEALVRKANGDHWSYSPTGAADQKQPTYLHPTYLAAVREWYGKVLEVARPHLGKCLVAIQIDNETNGYWGGRFGDVDYSPTAVAFYREWLEKKYGTIATLNARYGTSHASFAAVEPPKSAPGRGDDERAKNAWAADWYEAGQAQSRRYLELLRGMVEELGFREPDVLFFTNDSPFSLQFDDFVLRPVLLHDGLAKNPVGLAGLDLYPKQSTTNKQLQDQPFQADWFTRLYDHWGDRVLKTGGFAWGAELQGGFYKYPLLGHPEVRPEATDQILARTIGRGLKGGAFYVMRDGLNADDSAYAYLAPIAADGTTTARYDVIKKWASMIGEHGKALLAAKPVVNKVAILANGNYQSPRGGILDDLQRLWAIEGPALFGWLANAGIEADALDARGLGIDALAKYQVVFYQNPDFVDEPTAKLLAAFVDRGGVLVNLLWPGRVDDTFRKNPATDRLSTQIFPAKAEGSWTWANPSRSGSINLRYAGVSGTHSSFWYETFWSEAGSKIEPFAWERTNPLGRDGKVVGYLAREGGAVRAFLGTNVWTRFGQDDYYTLGDEDLGKARDLARWLVGLGGEKPIVETSKPRHLAWARRSGDAVYLFVVNDRADPGSIEVRLRDLAALGLDPKKTYAWSDVLAKSAWTAPRKGEELATGISIPTGGYGTAVVRIEPR